MWTTVLHCNPCDDIFWTDAESTLLLCFIYNHFQINVNLQIDLKTIETIYLNTQGQCLTTPNSFTTILIYHYSDFFDDLKNDQFLLRISVSLGFFACTLAYMSIISLFRALDMEGSAFTQLSTLDGIWLGKGTWWKTQDWNLFEIPLGLRAVHLQVAPQHVHTGIVNSPGTLQCILPLGHHWSYETTGPHLIELSSSWLSKMRR